MQSYGYYISLEMNQTNSVDTKYLSMPTDTIRLHPYAKVRKTTNFL